MVDQLLGIMRKALRGFATSNGRVQKRLPVGLSLTSSGMAAAVDNLNAMILGTPGPIYLLGHSRGAQIIGDWLATYGRTAPPDLIARIVTVILLGNPQRAVGGRGGTSADGKKLIPTPSDTPFEVIDFCRRADGWANADGWWVKPWAIPTKQVSRSNTAHLFYANVSPFDAGNLTRARVGRTTYMVSPV
ncbi:PE-PPE domain-containing protein [Mycobacterium hodleri]|uniref:PE-PPE domain-containing protein n=2 Tax=Mycolicibacterium hodleri TaxID=49897 RepID=A0A502E307_9MYCO|nr:PE-PPE domain-containing protein [Mycolicibacterium hodleri]